MAGKTFIVVTLTLVGATSIAAAQSQRNFGPNGPSSYGCYGEIYTGTAASRCRGTPEGGPGGQWQQYQEYPQHPKPQYQQRPQWQWQRLY